jgi:hypothetical protein
MPRSLATRQTLGNLTFSGCSVLASVSSTPSPSALLDLTRLYPSFQRVRLSCGPYEKSELSPEVAVVFTNRENALKVRIPVIVSSDSGANVSTIPAHREHDSGANVSTIPAHREHDSGAS